MKAEKIQKEQVSHTIQPMRKGNGGTAQFVDNRKPIQLVSDEEEESLQLKKDSAIQKKPNNTGLPDNLKNGIENLSGFSMDDVRVHYNSVKPATVQALAYTQGTNIHVAPGQERHLPHEAWHVVQQMQGRVQPTMQLQGMNVNDDEGLEKEADVMGGKVLQAKKNDTVVIYQGIKANTTQFILDESQKQFWSEKLKNIYKFLFSKKRELVSQTIPNWKKNKIDTILTNIRDSLDQIRMFFYGESSELLSICNQIDITFRSLKDNGTQISDDIKNPIFVYLQAFRAENKTKKAKLYLENRDEYKNKEPSANDALLPLKKKSEDRVLDITSWNLKLNEIFMDGGIDTQSRFKFKTQKLTDVDFKLIEESQNKSEKKGKYFLGEIQIRSGISEILYDSSQQYQIKVLAREIAQLLDAGYIFMPIPSKTGFYSFQALPLNSKETQDYIDKKYCMDVYKHTGGFL